jgi:hypothetical protein
VEAPVLQVKAMMAPEIFIAELPGGMSTCFGQQQIVILQIRKQ